MRWRVTSAFERLPDEREHRQRSRRPSRGGPVRARRGHLGWLAKELNVGLSALEEFGTGKGNLPPDALSAIARVLLGDNVVYDAARDKLRRAGPEPRSLGITCAAAGSAADACRRAAAATRLRSRKTKTKAPRRLGIKRMWSMSLAESIAFVLAVSLAVALLIGAT